jgi:hypothetical protein
MKIVNQVEEEIIVTLDDFLSEYEIDEILDYIQESKVFCWIDSKNKKQLRYKHDEIKKWAMSKFDLIERPNE